MKGSQSLHIPENTITLREYDMRYNVHKEETRSHSLLPPFHRLAGKAARFYRGIINFSCMGRVAN